DRGNVIQHNVYVGKIHKTKTPSTALSGLGVNLTTAITPRQWGSIIEFAGARGGRFRFCPTEAPPNSALTPFRLSSSEHSFSLKAYRRTLASRVWFRPIGAAYMGKRSGADRGVQGEFLHMQEGAG